MVNFVDIQGLNRLLSTIESSFNMYTYAMTIIPICITFQMCYVFRRNHKIMFFSSFIPWVFVLRLGLRWAFHSDSFFENIQYHALEVFVIGIFLSLTYFVIKFPIIPICLIYQII